MDSKTIKISKETYVWLLGLAAEMQKKEGKIISFDETLTNLRKEKIKKRKNIRNFAGILKDMTDKEADEIKSSIKELRKKSTRDLIKNDIYRF